MAAARRLNRFGVTAVTDTTATDDPDDLELLARAVGAGLPLRVTATGGPGLPAGAVRAPLRRGPVKLVLADHDLPTLAQVCSDMARARRQGRTVAVHCVTRLSLVLALTAWEDVGARPGDRVEHGAVVPPDLRPAMARLGVTVVTQPNFVAERGDAYLAEVDPDDRPWLYPCAGLLAAGIPVALGTDAPFGHPDPWRAVAAAASRRTAAGSALCPDEAVPAAVALSMLLSEPARPGGPPRRVRPGAPADLCLLDRPLGEVLGEPSAERVAATFVAGRPVYRRVAG